MKTTLFSFVAVTATLCGTTHGQTITNITAFLDGLGPAPITDPRFHDWRPPGSGDVRGPCPGLNTLANHGFINRNGKNLTIPMLITGGASGFNMGPDFMSTIAAVGVQSSPNPSNLQFDLNNLDMHNFPIEHDVSLSRQDHYFGNWYDFNNTVWQGTLKYFRGQTNTTTPTASAARYHRVKVCEKTNPQCLYDPEFFFFSSGETGLYVQVLSSPLVNSAPLSYVRTFFEKNQLPVSQGWTPSTVPITFPSLGNYVVELYAANPDKVIEAKYVTQDAYGQVLVLAAGGAAALNRTTQGISSHIHVPGILP